MIAHLIRQSGWQQSRGGGQVNVRASDDYAAHGDYSDTTESQGYGENPVTDRTLQVHIDSL